MGKKTERIAQLEDDLAATRALIRTIGGLVSVDIGDDVSQGNVARYTQRFAAALGRLRDLEHTAPEARPDPLMHPRTPATTRNPGNNWDTFDGDVDDEIDRLEETGLVPSRAGAPEAMVPSAERAGAADVRDIARELGLDVAGMAIPEALGLIYQQILRIKNPGDVALEVKSDSLVDAISHGRKAEHDARDELRAARESIARIAAAMQIQNWDPRDPSASQILERVQFWESLKLTIRKRIQIYAKEPTRGCTAELLVLELRSLLAQIIAPLDVARFLNRVPPGVTTANVMKVIEAREGLPVGKTPTWGFSLGDIALMGTVFADHQQLKLAATYEKDRAAAFGRAFASMSLATREDLRTFLNLVVVPHTPTTE